VFYQYNNINFVMVRTNDFRWEAVYSDDDADLLFFRVNIDIEAHLNPQAMAFTQEGGIPTLTPGALPATTFAAIRHQLMQPFGHLQVTDYLGQVVLLAPSVGMVYDVANGPKPRLCQPRPMGGSRTWAFRWVCECAVLECPGSGSPSAVLSNRWQEEHMINQFHLTTRQVNGKAVFRRDILDSTGQVAHDLLNGLIPPTPPGFQRESLHVVAESSGLALLWRVRDQELVADLGETDARQGGSGIVKIEGSYGVTSISSGEGPPGAMSMAQVDVRAYGNSYANQWTMVQRCFQLALTKVSVGLNTAGFIRHVAIRQSLGTDAKWVELTIAFQQTPPTAPELGSIRIEGLRKDVSEIYAEQNGVNPGLPNVSRGTAIVTALTAALRNACTPVTTPVSPGAAEQTTPQPPYGPPPAISVEPVEELPVSPGSGYSPDPVQQEAPYTRYKNDIEVETQTHTVQTPSTGPPPDATGGGGSTDETGSMRTSGPGSTPWSWPSIIFMVASPTAKMRISFQAERVGLPPLVPTLTPNDGNLVLSRYVIRPNSPITWNDGVSRVYSVNGFYEFHMRKAVQIDQPYRMGVLPWTSIPFTEALLRPDDFVSGIFDDPDQSESGVGPSS
jgi:hypothetical protein